MGLFDSKKITTTSDNRVVNDYSGSNLDYSVNHEFDNSIEGEYAGNTGSINVTTTDGGAFDLVDSTTSKAFSLMSNGFDFALESIGLNAKVTENAISAIDEQGQRNLAAALKVSELGYMQSQSSNQLAADLFGVSQATAAAQQKDNNNALANGYQSAMQFIEDFSRSDGAAVAQTNMKVVGIIVGGVILSVIAYKAIK